MTARRAAWPSGRGVTSISRASTRQPARAARQALDLCEAEQQAQRRIRATTARAALRAAGLPPQLAAALRARIHLIPEQAARQ